MIGRKASPAAYKSGGQVTWPFLKMINSRAVPFPFLR